MDTTKKKKPIAIAENTVFQHAAEAAFLWILKDIAIVSPHQTINDICKLENRIDLHIDGLLIVDDRIRKDF